MTRPRNNLITLLALLALTLTLCQLAHGDTPTPPAPPSPDTVLPSAQSFVEVDWGATPFPADSLAGAALGDVRPPFSYVSQSAGLFGKDWFEQSIPREKLETGLLTLNSPGVEAQAGGGLDQESKTANLIASGEHLFQVLNTSYFQSVDAESSPDHVDHLVHPHPTDNLPDLDSIPEDFVYPEGEQGDDLGVTEREHVSPLFNFRRMLGIDTPAEEWTGLGWVVISIIGACCVLVMLLLPVDPKMVPIRGQVFYNERPLTHGTVMFQPEVGPTANGTLQPDGTFVLHTPSRGKGGSVGLNRVRILSFVGQEPGETEVDAGQLLLGRSVIPKKFADYETSGLEVNIKPEGNKPFIIQLSDSPVPA